MPSHHRLQQYAIAVSILSLFYSTAEGVVSIVFGAESSSHALVFYGLQSAVEVISDFLVTWRFLDAFKSGDGLDSKSSPRIVQIERISTTIIGALLVALAIAAIATSGASLAAHDTPSTTLPSILIAGVSTGFTFLLYLAKSRLAKALDSSALQGEALCGLCCMQLSIVLFIGSLIYGEWKGGWWVDSATAILIGLMFGWEGVKMIKWARSKGFDGGCCGNCNSKDVSEPASTTASVVAEKLQEPAPTQERNFSSCLDRCCGTCIKEKPASGEQV